MYIAKERCPLAIWMPQNASAVGSVFDWLQSAADMRSGKNGESGVIQHSIFPLWRYAAWVREVFVLLAVTPRPFLQFSLNRCEKLDSLMYPIRHLNWDNKHFRWQRFNRGGLDCSILFLRVCAYCCPHCPSQGDEVVLQSTFTIQEEHAKLCLAAEGFGSRLCRLEPTSNCKVKGLQVYWENLILSRSCS